MSEETTYDYTKPWPKDESAQVRNSVFDRFLGGTLTFEEAVDELTTKAKMRSGEARFNVSCWRRYKEEKERPPDAPGKQVDRPHSLRMAYKGCTHGYDVVFLISNIVIGFLVMVNTGDYVTGYREELAPWGITGDGVDYLAVLAGLALMYGVMYLLRQCWRICR